jgi:predicted HicB family RNase H-like nuclease
MMFRKWTDDEKAMLAELVAKRFTTREIGKHIGKTHSAIRTQMYRLGIESHRTQGCTSKVDIGNARGGTILVRVSQRMHRQFLQACQAKRKSMNEVLADAIRNEIERKDK